MDINVNLLNTLANNMDSLNKFMCLLMIALVANIVTMIIKFYLDRKNRKHESILEKRKLIFQNAIKLEHEIYQETDALADYTKEQSGEMITEINAIRDKLNNNRIFFEERVYKAIDNVLDYYSEISGNYRKKDYKKEKKLMKKFIEAFNG